MHAAAGTVSPGRVSSHLKPSWHWEGRAALPAQHGAAPHGVSAGLPAVPSKLDLHAATATGRLLGHNRHPGALLCYASPVCKAAWFVLWMTNILCDYLYFYSLFQVTDYINMLLQLYVQHKRTKLTIKLSCRLKGNSDSRGELIRKEAQNIKVRSGENTLCHRQDR